MSVRVCVWRPFVMLSLVLVVCATAVADDLRLNQIQVIATHNSYHVRPPEKALKAAIAANKEAGTWDYTRQPLDRQLDEGVRSFELDLHVAKDGTWRVMHVPMLDAGTTVETFAEALQVIRAWSDAHPRHVPISLLLELKEEGFGLSRAYRRPEAADLDQLDELIRSAFSADRLLTPDDVRGDHTSLYEAVHTTGWPKLSDVAGQVFVILHEQGPHRAAYLKGREALEGRAMFVESELGQPHSAVLIRNNPQDRQTDDLAREGYLVRTRVDSQGSIRPAQRERALASGAHILTTDYPRGEEHGQEPFTFPQDAPARVNPITGKERAPGTLAEPIP
ncbi:MAG: hypothetical protein KF708_05645 [Pirellulales bacterium]|nr:hypothetical protein [Pirellulales bacterium]